MIARWPIAVLRALHSELPGVVVVVTDPDHLLNAPQMIAAIEERGLTLLHWDGSAAMLRSLPALAEGATLVLAVDERSPHLHLVRTMLPDQLPVAITAALVAKKFDRAVVKGVPTQRWDEIVALDQRQQETLPAKASGLLLARALYGVDAAFIRCGGWWPTLIWLQARAVDLPAALAQIVVADARDAVAAHCPEVLGVSALGDVSVRSHLLAQRAGDPAWLASLAPPERALAEAAQKAQVKAKPTTAAESVAWPLAGTPPCDVVAHCHRLLEADAAGAVDRDMLGNADEKFSSWLLNYYNTIVQQEPTDLMLLHTLVKRLCEEGCGPKDRLLLVVLDAVGLRTWLELGPIWQRLGVFGSQLLRPALASLPTLTSVSRLAIFEGERSTSLWAKRDKFAAECAAWKAHPSVEIKNDRDRSELFRHASDQEPDPRLIANMERGVARLAVLDVGWDEVIHHLDPNLTGIDKAIASWAERSASVSPREL